ncbi:MAG: response regulator transcription factor [Bacteroidetes bacterium]|nr:response regulator transcription factor [Bacteroidota bacterium]
MLKAIIIDDELKGRLALKQKIIDYCKDLSIVAEATSGEEGIEQIKKFQPNIIFLDIEMPRMDGFEMLRRIENKNFHIIFTTAYDQYAIKAIKFAAFDYLLKPVDIEELRSCVEKIKQQSQNNTPQKLKALEENLHPGLALNKLAIPTLDGLLFFNIGDIIHLEAQSNYTAIYFTNHPKLVASRTLKEFEDLLPAEVFFRAHHSHIINLQYIKRYIRGDGGQIEMQNGNFVDLARRKKDEFLKLIG